MVLAPVTVVDSLGRNVTGLGPENFRLFDGKEQREIVSFSREDQSVSVGIVFDCSRSMTDKFATAREAPHELFRELEEGDETFLVSVANSALLRQPFTSNFADLENSLLFIHPDGSTALVDGVYTALAHMKKAQNPRRALIIVSDGGENNSRYTMSELRKVIAEADARIFTICLHNSNATKEEAEGPDLLTALARSSGGINFPITHVSEMAEVMSKIGIILHNQYVLGYYPPANAPSGKYRPITVDLLVPRGLPRMHIYARSGYYAPER